MPPPPPPDPSAPPALPVELVEQILLRVPPDDPASLVRAALACKRWCGLVADRAFRRRRLEIHGATPPLLGFLCDGSWDGDHRPFARFIPTSSCRPPRADHRGRRAFDAHHGRVLLHGSRYEDFVVWDPITDYLVELPRPPDLLGNRSMKATVLCAAIGSCDHLDCHRGPFIVVLVGTNDDFVDVDTDSDDTDDDLDEDDMVSCGYRRVPKEMFARVYSSESGAWIKPTYAEHPGDNVGWGRSAIVGSTVYFQLNKYDKIIKYDLGTGEMTTIGLPYVRTKMIFTDFVPIELTNVEDGRLGFARVEESNELCLWSRDEDNEVAGWTLHKVIDLNKLFPLVDSITLKHCLVGFAESVCVAFVAVQDELFSVDMKSGHMKKVSEGCTCCAVPYFDFCTPALQAFSRDDGPRVGT